MRKEIVLAAGLLGLSLPATALAEMPEYFSWISPRTYSDLANEKIAPFKISGEYMTTAGHFSADDRITWKYSNYDLNERNYRMLFGPDRENTFDPRLFSRFMMNLDTDPRIPFVLHTNLTVDPWSFTGKTSRARVRSTGGDEVDFQLKYWSNTGRTVPESFETALNGDSFAIPELYVQDGVVVSTTINSLFGSQGGYSNTVTVPALKVQETFQPVREAWVGWKKEDSEIRVFPMAYEDQALTSNDPLQLSNHHIYWEPSPWTADWTPGIYHPLAQDFSRGRWNTDLAFNSRDSDGKRLTALRGISIRSNISDDPNSFQATIATPKSLWQSYDEVTALPGAIRKRYELTPGNVIGMLYGFRLGFRDNRQDAYGQVGAIDGSFTLFPFLRATLEGALSLSKQDQTTDFSKRKKGGAWQGKLISDLKFNSDEYKEPGRLLMEVSYTQMTNEFDPVLANYRNTRNDQFWSRHIHFENPVEQGYLGSRYPQLFAPGITYNDVRGARLGDGIDVDRNVFRLHQESAFFGNSTELLLDLRDVRSQFGKWVETVARAEASQKILERVVLKGLAIGQRMPDTTQGLDPYLQYQDRNESVINNSVAQGKDPSIYTYSAGMNYRIFDWFSLNGSYERTNDWGTYPRGLLLGSSFATETIDQQTFRRQILFLYGQNLFPLPPYPYYNIFKIGGTFQISPWAFVEQDWTTNDNRYAGQIDNNMNSYRTTLTLSPIPDLLLRTEYAYTQVIDVLKQLNTGVVDYQVHHNVAAEASYRTSKDTELVASYGIGGFASTRLASTFSPYLEGFPVLDTQDFIRVTFRGRF